MGRESEIAQHEAFRSVLQAMARPGTAWPLSARGVAGSALEDLLGCLLDAECSLGWLDGRDEPVGRGICRGTGCRGVPPEEADFVLVGPSGTGAAIAGLRTGEPDFPDRGCTLVYRVESLSPSGGRRTWTGPGIRDGIRPLVEGVPDSEWEALKATNSVYPMGVDCLFVDRAGLVAALPRSTRIGEAD